MVVSNRLCIRCGQPVTLEDGQLVYCSYCGAPQIFLSEELQEQIRADALPPRTETAPAADIEAAEAADAADGERVPAPPVPHRTPVLGESAWPTAVEYALLSGGIALGLDLGAMLFAPLLILAWLWLVSAPILTVGFYGARAPRPSAAFAARLGLLTGLLVALGSAVVLTVSLLLTRFAFHGAASFDTQFAAAVAQARDNAVARYGNAAEPMLRLLYVPEFRVGFLLWMAGIATAGYLLLATVGAGVAGLLLGRRRTA